MLQYAFFLFCTSGVGLTVGGSVMNQALMVKMGIELIVIAIVGLGVDQIDRNRRE